MKILRLILGDQLNYSHSWFGKVDDKVTYVMMEIEPEATYVKHHIQKLLGFFASMRNFADHLRKSGHRVIYYKLTDRNNRHGFAANLKKLVQDHSFEKIEYLYPDEYRVDRIMKNVMDELSIPHQVYDTRHFYTERGELREYFRGKKRFLMESFYRHMRRKHGVLMLDGEPETGTWNYDKENRKGFDPDLDVPEPLIMKNNLAGIHEDVDRMGIQHFGEADPESFAWPINREQSLKLLHFFIRHALSGFGTYQDAMAAGKWSLFHSRLSFSLNTKMISPHEVIEAVVRHWHNHPETGISNVEGFVRQILGWREFMRGVYWDRMPGYERLNFFRHTGRLPGYFWNGDTRMNCVRQSVMQSLQHAYAHHIQRLMITGNFCLLSGCHPDEVDKWYLGVYIDAVQWVEITNTRGMSQFADGGLVATKPYVSSGGYINRMSDYCQNCHYRVSVKFGEKACPFNVLYWHFLERHKDKLQSNPRMKLVYRNWFNRSASDRNAINDQAENYLRNLPDL